MADIKFTELTENTSRHFNDIIAMVDDPGGTPVSQKIKILNATGLIVNAQTGTSYTYLTGDYGKLVTHTNASPVAGTLPQAGASFPANWFMFVQNRGAGALTITPTTSTIDGAATLVLNQNEGALVVSDGTHYFTSRGKATGGVGGVGDVVGPGSSTDNALVRFDSTTGKLIQNSTVTLDDDGAITVPEIAAPGTPAAGKVVIYAKSDNKVYRKGEDGVEAELGGGGSIAPLTIIDANTVEQKNGTNAQTFSVFKTTTNNYKFSITNASNTWQLKSESSSGTPDPIRLYAASSSTFYSFDNGALLPPADITQNLGSLGNRWNQIHGSELFVASTGSISFSTSSTKIKSAGDGILDVQTQNSNVGGTIRFVPTTASQITADQNNYSSGGISKYQRWSSDASRNVTGFVTSPTQVTGQEHVITNVGSNDIVLVNESASSTAANRFTTHTGANVTLGANEMALIWYDGTTSRWHAAKL